MSQYKILSAEGFASQHYILEEQALITFTIPSKITNLHFSETSIGGFASTVVVKSKACIDRCIFSK